MRLNRNLLLIYAAAFLRSSGVGLTGVLLGIYLARLGFSASRIGVVIAAGMAGTALATLLVSFRADRFGRRRTLISLSFLMSLGGVALALTTALPGILLLSFLGMLNGMGRDRGAAFALEQAIIPETASAERRTWALAWYNLVLDAGLALGALAGTVPFLFRRILDIPLLASYQLTFALYAALGLISATLYAFLSSQIEVAETASLGKEGARISPGSRKVVAKLAALSGMDSLGGGFLTSALIAYWFFRRFGVAEESLGPLFFVVRLVNAGSYLVAAWLARRIGLLNTMVFTHIPSSLFLLALPFAPSFPWAVGLFLARESLVEMDVPTRQSYLVAVVEKNERTFASGTTNVTRNVAWAAAPSFAGYFMQHLALAAPLFVGGGIKIVYDLLLYGAFRRLKPPEESESKVGAS
ncbi:MAG: MFS transporter [Terriglobia bacterium]